MGKEKSIGWRLQGGNVQTSRKRSPRASYKTWATARMLLFLVFRDISPQMGQYLVKDMAEEWYEGSPGLRITADHREHP